MAYNQDVDALRDTEYGHLNGQTYLDHGGTTLYARSLIQEFSQDLLCNLYGNPHSASTPSAVAGHRVDAVREKALRFFGADPQHYDLIFVSNATAAIKLVMECMGDYVAYENRKGRKEFWYGYHKDAHNSVVGVREHATKSRCFASDGEVEDLIRLGKEGPSRHQVGLFAYPGQSNMTGRRLPLSWSSQIRKSSHGRIYTLLDAAALATTCPLNLNNPVEGPDFVTFSFYKIFGFPNVGALIVRKAAGHVLQRRRYFGGGTVDMVITIGGSGHAKRGSSLHDQLEDGTLPFHSIFALDIAIDVHTRLFKSMERISKHTAFLASYLYNQLQQLRHDGGSSPLQIYTDDASAYGNSVLQGATIAFNVYTREKKLIPCQVIEKLADKEGIFIRSGSMCNPGGVASYLGYRPQDLKRAFDLGFRCSNPLPHINGKPAGVVRVSLGAMSTRQDVDKLVLFLKNKVLLLGGRELVQSEVHDLGNVARGSSVQSLEGFKVPDLVKSIAVEKIAMVSTEDLPLVKKRGRLVRFLRDSRWAC